ncbi:MAG: type II 3-dehydroquinate dehydratase [Thermodesulfobacteriota bacterium]|nr:type II 3-dehydroquinate dehydratase [Thermodesulfobacteriota bacterium]
MTGTDKKTILVIHGPNLNMLGKREPEIYGKQTLDQINNRLKTEADALGFNIKTFQSNYEGAIVEQIQAAFQENYSAVIINPAAYTHTSVAIKDALLLLSIPVIEVHLSNIYKREAFRHHSMVSSAVAGQITGFGSHGYLMALNALKNMI